MKFVIVSVYDSMVNEYVKPGAVDTTGNAIRGFQQEANNPESNIFKYPDQYTLFHVADFDTDTGVFTPLQTPKSLGLALNFKG